MHGARLSGRANPINCLANPIMGGMRHVQANYIHPGIDETADHFCGIGGGSECGDDFCSAHRGKNCGQDKEATAFGKAYWLDHPHQSMRVGDHESRFQQLELSCEDSEAVRLSNGACHLLDRVDYIPAHCNKSMADIANKYSDNVTGKYYVDNQCIDCDLCRETAPNNFTRNDDGGYSYVFKQPTTPEEEAQCKEAMEGCPVEAIGNNGEAA